MMRFLIFVALIAAIGAGGLAYLLRVADEMAPDASVQEVEVDVTLPR